jgi:FtsH-binding integral membrane protein
MNRNNDPFEVNGYRNSNTNQNAYNQNSYNGNPYSTDPYGSDPYADGSFTGSQSAETLSTYMAKTFAWMGIGLLLTFLVGFGLYASGLAMQMAYRMPMIWMVVVIAEIAVVAIMSIRFRKLSPAGATAFFLSYAVLTGITFSILFLTYGVGTMIYAFGITALFFGGMAAVATIFHLDLSRLRNYLFGALIFLLIFSLVAFITRIPGLIIAEAYLGIALFVAYTAYDVRKVEQDYYMYRADPEFLKKASVFSALQLYLDFINIFIRVLRILGRSSRD